MTMQTNEANPPIVIKQDSHCVVTTASSHLHFAFDNQLAKLCTCESHDLTVFLLCCIAEQECLSPFFGQVRPVIVDDATIVTTNSILLVWDVNNPLPDTCLSVVFSIPPYMFTLEYKLVWGVASFSEVRKLSS